MEIKKSEDYDELIFQDFSIYIYPNDNKAKFRWTFYGPNTMIDDESVREEQIYLIHIISSVIEYIKQQYQQIDNIEIWGDSGYYEFAMFEYEKFDNFREYYYYNLALFGETWFEKHFKAQILCSDYERIKPILFLDPNLKDTSWDSFKQSYHIRIDTLKPYYETTATMRDFFLKIRENHTPIETGRLIGQWITWYIDRVYNAHISLMILNIYIQKQDNYPVVFEKNTI